MVLALDFHRRQRPLFRAPWWLRGLLLGAAMAALAAALADVSSRFAERERLEKRLSALRLDVGPAHPRVRVLDAPRPADKAAQALLAAPWESMFAAVERCRTEDIALLGLTAEQGSRELVLKGQAKNIASLKEFVASLARQAAFEQVLPDSHKPVASGTETVAFEIKARWR